MNFYTSCAFAASLSCALITTTYAWETSNPFEGVTYNKLRNKNVHPILGWSISSLKVDVFEIQMDAPGISITSTPDNYWDPGETTRQTTLNFMNQSKTEIAFNTSYFRTVNGGNDNHGVLASDGKMISQWGTEFPFTVWPAINITATNQVELVTVKGKNLYDYYNACTGSAVLVHNNNVIGDPNSARHPRTAIGYNTIENKLVVMTVDGRSTDSLGVKLNELGKLMQNFGATWAINLDGGGSTQLTMNNGTAHYINSPSEKYRSVGANMGIHANIDNTYREIANFEHNNKSNFNHALHVSGSNKNISGSSNYQIVEDAAKGQGALKLEINKSVANENWHCRVLSGSGSATKNVKLKTDGYIGIWAKTTDLNQQIALAIDEGSDLEKSTLKELIADGEWHYYEWSLDDNRDWIDFVGNGQITNTTYSLDSVLLYGQENSTTFIDNIVHDSDESMIIPEPASLGIL